jgi:hypothetical protein
MFSRNRFNLVSLQFFAVVGLPEPRRNHAIVMVKFANDMLVEMSAIVSALETRLGPGTANLRIRVGVSIVCTCSQNQLSTFFLQSPFII